jgi:hypothetical protein
MKINETDLRAVLNSTSFMGLTGKSSCRRTGLETIYAEMTVSQLDVEIRCDR